MNATDRAAIINSLEPFFYGTGYGISYNGGGVEIVGWREMPGGLRKFIFDMVADILNRAGSRWLARGKT